MKGIFDLNNNIIPLLKQEELDFEIIDINQLVCNGFKKSSNILVIPEIFYEIFDKCVDIEKNSSKLNVILTYNSPFTQKKVEHSRTFNIVDYINLNSSSDKIKNTLLKHL